MKGCLTADELTALAEALRWSPEDTLSHLAGCPDCHTRLRQLATLHDVLQFEVQPRAGFVDDLMGRLPQEEGLGQRHVGSGYTSLVNPLLAALTTCFALAVTSPGQFATPFDPPVLFAALLIGALTIWWQRQRTADGAP